MAMPNSIRHDFELLTDELAELRTRWRLFRQLYGTSKGRSELLLATAPTLFEKLFRILHDDVMLGLCRLTDKAETSGNQNLVLKRLLDELGPEQQPLSARLQGQLSLIAERCKPFRRHRDKRLSHLDAKTATNAGRELLPTIPAQRVEEAFAAIEKFMNMIQIEFDGCETHFTPKLDDDAESLIVALQKAWAYDELVKEGKVPWNRYLEGRFGEV